VSDSSLDPVSAAKVHNRELEADPAAATILTIPQETLDQIISYFIPKEAYINHGRVLLEPAGSLLEFCALLTTHSVLFKAASHAVSSTTQFKFELFYAEDFDEWAKFFRRVGTLNPALIRNLKIQLTTTVANRKAAGVLRFLLARQEGMVFKTLKLYCSPRFEHEFLEDGEARKALLKFTDLMNFKFRLRGVHGYNDWRVTVIIGGKEIKPNATWDKSTYEEIGELEDLIAKRHLQVVAPGEDREVQPAVSPEL